ncbi:MAG: radical SAM protein [Calditrichaeota bacterium]|nr:MAG: radical SAM protein [Calditrichota bacterium]
MLPFIKENPLKKILLAHSYFLRFDPKMWETMQPYTPLGTLYATSYLQKNNFEVALFDSMLADSTEDFKPIFEKFKPDVVVFFEDNFNYLSKMCLTRMREACLEMAKFVKENSSAKVIACGSDASDRKGIYLNGGIDYLLIGEGEQTLLELLQELEKEEMNLSSVKGLAYLENENLTTTPPREFIKKLDELPFPAWDLVDVKKYKNEWLTNHNYFSMNLVTTRGCPFKCNWCAKPIYGNRYNNRSPKNVAEEMAFLKKNFQPNHIWFADDIFGIQLGWMVEFGEEVEKLNAQIPFKIQSRVDLLQDANVKALKKAGCQTVWVGAESGSQKILDAMDKGTQVEQIYEANETLKKYEIEVCFFIQFGYLGETYEDIEKTFKMIRECKPDQIGISVSYPLPGTKFYEMVKEQLGEKQNWEHSQDLEMMFSGTYSTEFYRVLYDVVHSDFRMRKYLEEVKGKPFSKETPIKMAKAVFNGVNLLKNKSKLTKLKEEIPS